MNSTATAIWAIVIVAIVALAIWLTTVLVVASRKPHQEPHGDRLRGPVQGGTHVGGGRSVAPRRDEAVDPEQVPAGDTVSPVVDAREADDTGSESDSEHARRGSGSPMDL